VVRLSGVVIVQDEIARIDACLDSLRFCDEIVVVDSGSTDGTLERLRARGVRLVERAFSGYADQKDHARKEARGKWVLNIDADEVVSPELASEVRRVADVEGDGPAAFQIPFKNYFRSVWVRRAGYYPDLHVRLFQRDRAAYDPAFSVHERLIVDGPLGTLSGHIEHHSFESLDDFLDKSRRYAARFADDAHRRGLKVGAFGIALHTVGRFVRAFVVKGGFLEGPLGLIVSGLQAYEVFQKYARLWELGRFGALGPGPK
jgi:glycosyltransferase involved in cell wall biosynthesis